MAGALAAAGIAALCVAGDLRPTAVPVRSDEHRARANPVVLDSEPAPDPRAVFEREVLPLLEGSAQRHQEAIERTVRLVEEEFERYERGVEPFVRDLTSLGTRGRVLWRSAKDWLREDTQVRELVEQTFERHLFSEPELSEFLELALRHAGEEFEADRNKLLRDARHAIDQSELPDLEIPDYATFASEVSLKLQATSRAMTTESAWTGVGTLLLSEAAATAATALIARALPAVIAGAGGATAAGSASGGAGGSLAGPIGTGVGLIGGFVVGAIFDAWLTEGLEADLTERLDGILNDVHQAVLHGDGQTQGLEDLLREHARRLEQAQAEVLERAVLAP